MDFSDIRTIIIGEAGEYGKRLVRYLDSPFICSAGISFYNGRRHGFF